ncbi:MAG: hypothetical protein RLZZ244_1862 [Verrucomicrobiota bacterium]
MQESRAFLEKKPTTVSQLGGAFLSFDALAELSPETAVALASFPGELVLKPIPELSPETAAALPNTRDAYPSPVSNDSALKPMPR